LTPNGGGGSLTLDDLAPQTASVQASSAPPAAVGVIVAAPPVIVTAQTIDTMPTIDTVLATDTLPAINTVRPLVSTSSAAITATVTTTVPASGPLVMVTPADWSAPQRDTHPEPTPADPATPVAAATQSVDRYFTELPPNVAAETSLTSDTVNVASDADDATDRFYEDFAQEADAQLCEV
jgi:hypothetical protein